MMSDGYPWVLGSPVGSSPGYRVASQSYLAARPKSLGKLSNHTPKPWNTTHSLPSIHIPEGCNPVIIL